MSDADWRIVREELGRTVHHHEWVQTEPIKMYITRRTDYGHVIVTQHFMKYPHREEEGEFPLMGGETIITGKPSLPVPRIISEKIELTDGNPQPISWTSWESDYITMQEVKLEDWIEYEVGLLEEVVLTNEGYALIAGLEDGENDERPGSA